MLNLPPHFQFLLFLLISPQYQRQIRSITGSVKAYHSMNTDIQLLPAKSCERSHNVVLR